MSRHPSAAQIVIIGGGIIGCSTAYHLMRAGPRMSCCSSATS
jgi:sarcosine dehydrogenase